MKSKHMDIYSKKGSGYKRYENKSTSRQTKYMINEAISLNTVRLDSGNIKLKENNRMDTKDRYVTCAMSNMFADKLNSKYILGSDQEDDFDIDDILLKKSFISSFISLVTSGVS